MLIGSSIGASYWVRPRVASFRRAIALAVRPHEARPIARDLLAIAGRTGCPFGDLLAGWFRAQFEFGTLRYIADPEGPLDFWSSPKTTLERGGGDCDDMAVLGASILRAAGLVGRVVVGTLGGAGHAWTEGCDDQGPFLLEATNGDLCRWQRPIGYLPNPAIT